MPPESHTRLRNLRVASSDWEDFGKAVERAESDRSTVLREFIAWYVRRPGAELPERP